MAYHEDEEYRMPIHKAVWLHLGLSALLWVAIYFVVTHLLFG